VSIALTERAAGKIRSLLESKGLSEKACLRVGVRQGGCAGLSYTLDVTDTSADDDEAFLSHGVRVVCDPKSYHALQGTTIDYDDALRKGGFVFDNPNAKSQCGCGESFSS